MSTTTRISKRLVYVFGRSSLVLIASLCFLVPFSTGRNIDMQGLVLLIAGGLAWTVILLEGFKKFWRLGRIETVMLCTFFAAGLASFALNPHHGYGLLGAPLVRLGLAGWLACLGCGLLVRRLEPLPVARYLYLGISALALLAIPYSLARFHSLDRLGGSFAQADVLACFIGCGILIGLELLRHAGGTRHRLLVINQLFLAAILALTGTRAVLLLVVILVFAWLVHNRSHGVAPVVLAGIGLIAVALGGAWYFTPDRLANTADASASINYRLQLQSRAFQASAEKPWLGYGPGNLADALDCRGMTTPSLRLTCEKGFFFNSSHNIFLDRVLAIGWPGGLAYFVFAGLALYRGLRAARPEIRITAYAGLLIFAYYFTNVTGAALELLFWIIIIRCLMVKNREDPA